MHEEDMHDGQRERTPPFCCTASLGWFVGGQYSRASRRFPGNDFLRDIENRGKETKGSAFDIDADDQDKDKEDEQQQEETHTGSSKKQHSDGQKVMTLENVMVDWIKVVATHQTPNIRPDSCADDPPAGRLERVGAAPRGPVGRRKGVRLASSPRPRHHRSVWLSVEQQATAHGRADTAMQKQTRRYLKLLFEKLETKVCIAF